jgi:hypothetical protein
MTLIFAFPTSAWTVICLTAPSLARGEDLSAADNQVRAANQRVMEEIRSGNRDSRKLMQIMAPAIKARSDALEKQANQELQESWKVERERRKAEAKKNRKAAKGSAKGSAKGPAKGAAKADRPAPPNNSLNGASRYGGTANDKSIVDPDSIPKEMTFEKRAKTAPAPVESQAPAAAPISAPSGSGGVNEIQF